MKQQNRFTNNTLAITILLGINILLMTSNVQAMPIDNSNSVNARTIPAESAGLDAVKNSEHKKYGFNFELKK